MSFQVASMMLSLLKFTKMGDNTNPINISNKESLKEYLNQRVNVVKSGCHEWNRCVKKGTHPYGVVHIMGRSFKAHRLSAYAHIGFDIYDKSIEVCHKCDNPICINPAHLIISTHDFNMKDASEKNRMKRLKGDKNPSAKLTPLQVEYIRKNKNKEKTYKQIAIDFNVNEMTIYRVVKGLSW